MNQPIRMCIVCKKRQLQKILFRFQLKEDKITSFGKHGRSFYICQTCLDDNEKNLIKALKFICKTTYQDNTEISKQLKEIIVNG